MNRPSHDIEDSWTVIWHLTRERGDLLPSCGQLPGDEAGLGLWHTVSTDARKLLAHCAVGHGVCGFCLDVARQQRAASG